MLLKRRELNLYIKGEGWSCSHQSNAFSAGQAASVFETELLLKTADIIACMSLED